MCSHVATSLPTAPSPAADYGEKVKIPLAGLTVAEIDGKLREAVEKGDTMPRAYHQSVKPFELPALE